MWNWLVVNLLYCYTGAFFWEIQAPAAGGGGGGGGAGHGGKKRREKGRRRSRTRRKEEKGEKSGGDTPQLVTFLGQLSDTCTCYI